VDRKLKMTSSVVGLSSFGSVKEKRTNGSQWFGFNSDVMGAIVVDGVVSDMVTLGLITVGNDSGVVESEEFVVFRGISSTD
jgi:hypothetical protein